MLKKRALGKVAKWKELIRLGLANENSFKKCGPL